MVDMVFHRLPATAYLFLPFMQAFIGPFIFCFGCFGSCHLYSNPLCFFFLLTEIHSFLSSTFLTCPLQTDQYGWLCFCFCQVPKDLVNHFVCWFFELEVLDIKSHFGLLKLFRVVVYVPGHGSAMVCMCEVRGELKGQKWGAVLFFSKWLNWSHQASSPLPADLLGQSSGWAFYCASVQWELWKYSIHERYSEYGHTTGLVSAI